MYTPWGTSQHVERYDRGFSSVFTAGHGGFMISKCFAEKHLSEAARKRAMKHNNYYCYEEDCQWAIPAWELSQYWDQMFQYASEDIKNNPKQYILEDLSYWNADYLLEIGVEPSEKEYKYYQQREQEEQMRKDKHPDLIVAAWGDWHTKRPGVDMIVTADGKEHFVTAESYDKVCKSINIRLLSNCVLVS